VALDSLGHLAAFVPLPNFPISLLVPQPLSYSGESRSYAGYSNVSYTPPVLDDKLELTFGLRETQDRKVLHQNFFDAAGNPIAGAAGFRDVARDFGNFSESASTKYQWDEDLMTYFRWSKAYKAGGFNPRSTGSLSATGFGPELASSYELGVKSELLNRHLRLNVDGFYTDYTNLQVSVIEPSSAGVQTITDNAGKARYTGGEFEMAVLPLTGWELDVTVGYVIPKFLEYKTSPTTDIADVAKFGSTSKATTNLRVQYSLPHLACGDVTLAANWAYLSSRYFGSNPLTAPFLEDIKSPGWNNVGAQITLADIPTGAIGKSLEVQLYGKNLLNAIQRVDGIDFGSSLGYAVNGYGPGREFGIALTAKF
jgi:iron complex outermembrane recepter protein